MNILRYWKEHPEYWISIKNKDEADKEITELFYEKYPTDCWISEVIYLDQFSRHFQRTKSLDEMMITKHREKACKIVIENEDKIKDLLEVEVVFVLMPFKHLQRWEYIFSKIHLVWLSNTNIKDFPILSKFYYDTYSKAYNENNIKEGIEEVQNYESFNISNICEFYSEDYFNSLQNEESLKLFPQIEVINNPIISLSGGVDSMVLLGYYKLKGLNPKAVHIIYGNRSESEEEYNFISKYCTLLKVPFFIYRIKWLKRGEVEREFYEKMTRSIRFSIYKIIGGNIVLGHIQDDVIENIWTNIATCKHLSNLKKMEKIMNQEGILIFRPLLDIDKKNIFKLAHTLGIPYLKNTTPSWSNRGKYREHFYTSVQKQYGECVDNNLLRFSETISSQFRMIDKILYQPILQSYHQGKFDITPAYIGEIDLSHWEIIFEKIFHHHLGSGKPSIHSIKNFYNRLQKMKYSHEDNIKIKLKKDITFNVFKSIYQEDIKIYLQILN